MSWNNQTTTQDKTASDSQFLKFENLTSVGQTTEVKVRILDEEPSSSWQHWVGNRPFNCLSTLGCPVCEVRKQAKKEGRDVRVEYPNNWRGFFNVLLKETGEVKVYGFGTGMEKTLRSYYDKYGDMRNYDITIQKRKTGPQPLNVEYTLFYEGPSELNNAEREAAEAQRVDLTQFTQPASLEDLIQVAQGVAPASPEERGATSSTTGTGLDLFKDNVWDRFQETIARHGLDSVSFGFTSTNHPSDEILQGIINGLENK